MSAAASDAMALTAARIAQRFGAENVVASSKELAAYEVDGMLPAATVLARSSDEIVEVLKLAAAEKLAVIPCGGRTKLGIGMPPARYDIALDVSRMNRILAYEPRDLTLGVEPGVRFETVWELLGNENQWLPVAPPFGERATIGGVLAADATSSLRHAYGGLRDFTLGMEFVTGYGAAVKSGGRVVKNVSGYDAHKLLIGSLGTLAVITRANFKTFPFPPVRKVFVVDFENSVAAVEFCRAMDRSALEPRLVEVISPEAAKIMIKLETGDSVESNLRLREDIWSVTIGVAAHEEVVARHAREIAGLSSEHNGGQMTMLEGDDQALLLNQIREFPAQVLAFDSRAAIFRIAVTPVSMSVLTERLNAASGSQKISSAMVLRPHGLIYFAMMADGAADDIARLGSAAEMVFRSAAEVGAKARIEFAPVELKRRVDVWGAVRPDIELMRRVKKVFDPENVLSPGRFAGGI